jgi:outer membrane protein TolC
MILHLFGWVIWLAAVVSALPSAAAESKGSDQPAKPFTLDQYVRQYLSVSPSLAMARIRQQQQQLNLNIARENWMNELSMEPSYTESNLEVDPGDFADKREDVRLQAELSQQTPWGTQFGLRGGYSWRQSTAEEDSTPTEAYAFYLQQNIWRNWAGQATQMQIEAAQAAWRQAQLVTRESRSAACLKAIQLYQNVYVLQQMQELYQQSLDDSKEIFDRYQQLFRQRLIKETELLTAESDWLANRNQVMDERRRFRQALVTFLTPIGREVVKLDLADPQAFVKGRLATVSGQELDQLTRVQQAEWQIAQQQARLALAREEAKSDVNLFVELGRNKTENIIDAGPVSQRNEYVQIGISAKIPLVNKIPSYEIEQARQNVALSQMEKQEDILNLREQLESLKVEIEGLQAKQDLTAKRTRVLERKLTAARQQVERRQMELLDYIRHRSELLTNRLEQLSVQREIVQRLTELWILTDHIPRICQVAS